MPKKIFNRCSVCPFREKLENGRTRCTDPKVSPEGCFMDEIVSVSETGLVDRFQRDYAHLVPEDYDEY